MPSGMDSCYYSSLPSVQSLRTPVPHAAETSCESRSPDVAITPSKRGHPAHRADGMPRRRARHLAVPSSNMNVVRRLRLDDIINDAVDLPSNAGTGPPYGSVEPSIRVNSSPASDTGDRCAPMDMLPPPSCEGSGGGGGHVARLSDVDLPVGEDTAAGAAIIGELIADRTPHFGPVHTFSQSGTSCSTIAMAALSRERIVIAYNQRDTSGRVIPLLRVGLVRGKHVTFTNATQIGGSGLDGFALAGLSPDMFVLAYRNLRSKEVKVSMGNLEITSPPKRTRSGAMPSTENDRGGEQHGGADEMDLSTISNYEDYYPGEEADAEGGEGNQNHAVNIADRSAEGGAQSEKSGTQSFRISQRKAGMMRNDGRTRSDSTESLLLLQGHDSDDSSLRLSLGDGSTVTGSAQSLTYLSVTSLTPARAVVAFADNAE
ncbi:hypothetical protein CBR_g30556 [Chara braunii]|uniref:Uncharacterized protein n=1 Tax=Chara braunii TaxID=69332 RepID=A0A388LD14_CHABU|nr:hypothetical protein CBR_g30556 [Chara braunii]|eukprot:GBG80190.1 hypothetical protein CBR_g30556 [Chara braunii]